jgi:hypothetical protein
MIGGQKAFILTLGAFFSYAACALADYTLILKNGRRITVQSYREEGGMIKFPGLGGEIGIGKDQIQAIRKDGEREKAAFDVSRPPEITTLPAKDPAMEERKITPPASEGKLFREKTLKEQKAKEEKQYQKKIAEITERLKDLRERYAAETRGNTGADPSFFTTEESFKGHQEDLLSRFRAAGVPVESPYTEREKKLSEMRDQMNQLESQRKALIDEMQQKGFDTGSLFLE